MTPVILRYGIIAGLIVSLPWLVYMLTLPADGHMNHSMLLGYTLMILAFSMVFVGIRQYRDRALGGVIKFGKALLLGLGISAVASLIYVIGWEICMAFSKYNFIEAYSKFILDDARAHGAGAAEMEQGERGRRLRQHVPQSAVSHVVHVHRDLPGRHPGVADLGRPAAQGPAARPVYLTTHGAQRSSIYPTTPRNRMCHAAN